MKQFILKLFIFACITIAIFFAINALQCNYNTNPIHYKMQYDEVKKDKTINDNIILGSSHATHSIRPEIMDRSGLKFYNYALNGASPEFYYKWYNELFKKYHPHPEYCLITIDWFMFDNNWLGREFDHDVEYFPAELFIKKLLIADGGNAKKLIYNRFPFLKYRKTIINSMKFQEGAIGFNVNDYDRGFISWQIPYDSKKFTPKKRNIIINSSQLIYFIKLVTQMHNEGVKIIFVMTPEYGLSKKFYVDMISLKIIEAISQEFGIPILNFNTEFRSFINEDIHYFSDWGHLNKSGSILFSSLLALKIKETIKTYKLIETKLSYPVNTSKHIMKFRNIVLDGKKHFKSNGCFI